MLKDRLRFLLKDTALYGVAAGISRFVVFVTIPIIVAKLTVAQFGIWSLLTMLGSILSAVIIFGMDSAVIRYYFDNDSEDYRRRLFTHGISIQLALSFVFSFTFLFFPSLYLGIVDVDLDFESEAMVLFSWIPANVLVQFIQNWFKWTFQRSRFLLISLGTALLNLGFLYFWIRFGDLDLKRILIIQSVASWTFAAVGIYWCRKNFLFTIDRKLVGELAWYGFPMMLVMLVGMLSPALDRLFLVHYLSEEQLGLYSFCQRLSVIMSVAVAAFQTAFGPFSFSIWDKPDAKETFSKFHTFYIAGFGIIALGIVSCGKILTVVLGTERYLDAIQYLPLLVIGVFFYGMYSFAAIGIFYSKKMLLNLLALTIGVGVIVTWNAFMVPIFRELGAAVGFAVGNFVMIVVAYFFSARYYKVNYSYFKDMTLVAVLLAVIVNIDLIVNDNIYIEALLRVVAFGGGYALLTAFLVRKDLIRIFRRG